MPGVGCRALYAARATVPEKMATIPNFGNSRAEISEKSFFSMFRRIVGPVRKKGSNEQSPISPFKEKKKDS